MLDEFDHFVKVAGVEHVGIGSDWDGIEETAAGLDDASRLPMVVDGLRRRGYSERDLSLICGENFLRVLEANRPSKP